MLFRRFIAHFRERKWADFVTELVIVVGGVFFAIQAANWNDNRLEQEKGRLFMERLTEDLRKDLNSRRALVRYYQAVLESGKRTVARLNAESIDSPTAFVIDAYRATEYAHRPPTRAAFDEIISSGSLGLMPSDARQAGVIEYFRYDNSLAAREAVRISPYRLRVRRLLPHDVQVAIRASCSDVVNDRFEITGFNENCELRVPIERMKGAAATLKSDPELLGDLRLHFSVINAQLPNFRGNVINLEATIEALEAAR